jgi:hypothetical protein
LAAGIAACAVSIAPLRAADIKPGFEPSFEVVLEGPIVSGDYDALRSFIETNEPRSVLSGVARRQRD